LRAPDGVSVVGEELRAEIADLEVQQVVDDILARVALGFGFGFELAVTEPGAVAERQRALFAGKVGVPVGNLPAIAPVAEARVCFERLRAD
jgi:hypothetical protein